MKLPISFLSVLFLVNTLFAQENKNLLGQQSPSIIFQESLDGNTSANFYKNKVLVLDFWATWCAPCIATFPHFNQLSKKYSSDSVVFASITDEPASIAQRFFERTKKELNAIKLCDTSHKTGNSFKVKSIPYCVILDKSDVVRWMGQTYDLTDEILESIIKNTQLPGNNPVIKAAYNPKPESLNKRTLFSFSVARSDTINGRVAGNSRNYKATYLDLSRTNTSLGSVLEDITGFSQSARIISNDSLKMKQLIDLEFKAGFDTTLFSEYKDKVLKGSARNNFIICQLGQALKFNIKETIKKQRHYELIVTDSLKLHQFISMNAGHSSFDADNFPDFEIVGYNLKNIAVNLEGSMKTIITTQIIDDNRYDLSLDISNIKTTNQTLQFHGLKLKEVNDEIELLTVDFY